MRTLIRRLHREDAGMTTAEYAIGTLAAVGLALVLYKVVTSDAVRGLLTGLIATALQSRP